MPPTTFGMVRVVELRVARILALGREGQEEVRARPSRPARLDARPQLLVGGARIGRALERRRAGPGAGAATIASAVSITKRQVRLAVLVSGVGTQMISASHSRGAAKSPSSPRSAAARAALRTPGCARCSCARRAARRPWPRRCRSRAPGSPPRRSAAAAAARRSQGQRRRSSHCRLRSRCSSHWRVDACGARKAGAAAVPSAAREFSVSSTSGSAPS